MKNLSRNNRFRCYEPQRQFSLRNHVIRVNAGLRKSDTLPLDQLADAVEQAPVKLGQGDYTRTFTPEPIDWRKFGRGVAVLCGLAGAVALAAQQMGVL